MHNPHVGLPSAQHWYRNQSTGKKERMVNINWNENVANCWITQQMFWQNTRKLDLHLTQMLKKMTVESTPYTRTSIHLQTTNVRIKYTRFMGILPFPLWYCDAWNLTWISLYSIFHNRLANSCSYLQFLRKQVFSSYISCYNGTKFLRKHASHMNRVVPLVWNCFDTSLPQYCSLVVLYT